MKAEGGNLKPEGVAKAFNSIATPFVRMLVAAMAAPADKIRAALSDVRQSLRLWLRHFDSSNEFATALEEMLGEEFARGLTSQSGIKASLADILERTAARSLLPTSLGHADIQSLSRDLRASSLFSARTTNADYLADMAKVLDQFLGGKINTATARLHLMKSLDAYGYTPEGGFPGDIVPPAEAGSLQDLSSASRINLILNTQAQLAFGRGQKIEGELTADEYPAWELVRIEARATERGDWDARFVEAGGVALGGRMIALKHDPVWEDLGSAALFNDALDTDHPPFAFNSGMGWQPVDRAECVRLGLVGEGYTAPEAGEPSFDERPPVDLSKYPADLREQLAADLARIQRDLAESRARDFETFKQEYAAR